MNDVLKATLKELESRLSKNITDEDITMLYKVEEMIGKYYLGSYDLTKTEVAALEDLLKKFYFLIV